jgi:Flp pilus assembly pilin Flp
MPAFFPVPARFIRSTRRFRAVLLDRSGQDLVEYALIMAVVSLGITSGMGVIATGIDTACSTVGTAVQNAFNSPANSPSNQNPGTPPSNPGNPNPGTPPSNPGNPNPPGKKH